MALLPKKATQQGGGLNILLASDPDELKQAMAALLSQGAAVTLSLTKNRETLSMTVLDNGKKEQAYFGTGEEFSDTLCTIIEEHGEAVRTILVDKNTGEIKRMHPPSA